MVRQELEKRLDEWKDRVLKTFDALAEKGTYGADTYRMIQDVDRIVAEAFDHDTLII